MEIGVRGWHTRPVEIGVRGFVAKSATSLLLDFEDVHLELIETAEALKGDM